MAAIDHLVLKCRMIQFSEIPSHNQRLVTDFGIAGDFPHYGNDDRVKDLACWFH